MRSTRSDPVPILLRFEPARFRPPPLITNWAQTVWAAVEAALKPVTISPPPPLLSSYSLEA